MGFQTRDLLHIDKRQSQRLIEFMEYPGPAHGRRQGDVGDGGTLPHHLGAQLQHTQARTCTGTDMQVHNQREER